MTKVLLNGHLHYLGKNSQVTIISRDGEISINGAVVQKDLRGTVNVVVEGGTIERLECDGSVTCLEVAGSVSAGGSVNCGNVGGDVSAGGSVKASGHIAKSINAGGSVRIG